MKVRISSAAHSGPNMTPLVDVVMVILIFLMLAGSFGGAEHYLGYHAQPPVTAPTAAVSTTAGVDPQIMVFVRAVDGLPSGFSATLDGRRISSAAVLEEELVALREKFESNGVKVGSVTVVVTPGRHVQYQHVLAAYQAAVGAEFTRVAFGAGEMTR